jgi:N-acyl-D-aspartate/D-glutamate deacylase
VAAVGIQEGRRRIDGSGLVLCPGFIDVHTHVDAQVFWDPFLTPSSLHGVTMVVAGNCGFSIAPLAPVDADYMMRLLARVEGIPLGALQEGVPWSWNTFGEYLAAVAEARPAFNFGAMVGHSALRRNVLGADSGAAGPNF